MPTPSFSPADEQHLIATCSALDRCVLKSESQTFAEFLSAIQDVESEAIRSSDPEVALYIQRSVLSRILFVAHAKALPIQECEEWFAKQRAAGYHSRSDHMSSVFLHAEHLLHNGLVNEGRALLRQLQEWISAEYNSSPPSTAQPLLDQIQQRLA